jgi:drug/metabolite transporter (DMT)-like permease
VQGADRRAIAAALGAAFLFGAGTPAAKPLLGQASPWLMAGLLYLGSGVGLLVYRLARRQPLPDMSRKDWGWLLAAIVSGGIVAPVLLMTGLAGMPASGASLLLNAEAVFTALLAWIVFRENFDRRIAIGMAAIVLGAVVIAWRADARLGSAWAAALVVGACLLWGVDNNLTRKVALTDASFIAMAKGLIAGVTNITLALALGADAFPAAYVVGLAMLIGLASYGASLTLFVVALRDLGTARTGAYFSTAPFAGAIFSLLFLGEPLTAPLAIGAALMAVGVWLHVTEHHEHMHAHEPMTHEHEHVHDEHHRHEHDPPVPAGTRHRHVHHHAPLTHRHAHYPDSHHRHDHDPS